MMKYNNYNLDIIEDVITNFNIGLNNSQLSKKFNIPRTTIKYWTENKYNNHNHNENLKIKNIDDYLIGKNKCYSYILGIYLGDGCISKAKKSYKIRIALDEKYYNIIEECEKNFKELFPSSSVGIYKVKNKNMYFVNVYSCNLLELFPQHGDGLKYKRDIKLEKFQYDIIDDVQLIKGLIHSDGCLYKANNKGYISFFYNFTNMSKNIIDILCGSLDNININYKINKHKNDVYLVNIYKQKDFIKLYSLIGTKNLKQIDENYLKNYTCLCASCRPIYIICVLRSKIIYYFWYISYFCIFNFK